ncbi:hypothetical protein SDC9_202555 [bioreactor metagenome]|uniref:Uncharacterized protein n=1 Tax=bioreactor metagenome TaxID=1076179 RepID=A0A645IUR2_9ZZZZ
MSNFGEVSVQCSNHGTENVPSHTEELRVFLMSGEQQLTFRQWYSETWVTIQQQVLLSQETLQQERLNSTESGLSTLRERML